MDGRKEVFDNVAKLVGGEWRERERWKFRLLNPAMAAPASWWFAKFHTSLLKQPAKCGAPSKVPLCGH